MARSEDRELALSMVPTEFRNIFCMCVDHHGTSPRQVHPDYTSLLPWQRPLFATSPEVCAGCDKPHRYLIMHGCKSCGEPYTYWYLHSYYERGKCYSCVVTETNVVGYYWPEFIYVPPRSNKELDSILDDLLNTDIEF